MALAAGWPSRRFYNTRALFSGRVSAAKMNAATLKTPRRAALAFVFVTVVLDMLAVGMIIPVLPKLVTNFMGGDTSRAAEVFGLFGTVLALMQFIFSPVLGGLSDRFGRRAVILVSNFGLGFDYLLMAMAPNLEWLFVGRVISGITAASIPTAFAYIADVTPPEKRAGAFGMVGAAFGMGFILGPALGGLLGILSPRLPFWVAGGLSLSNAMYGLFVLPESLAPENRAKFTWAKANPIGSLALLRAHKGLLGLAVILFLINLAHEVLPSTFVLYADYRYHWGSGMVGVTLATVGVLAAVVQGGLANAAVLRFGEQRVVLLGLLFGMVGFAIYGLAGTGLLFWGGTPFMALWGLAGVALQGLMTRRVASSEQGRLQGANSSLKGITGLIGPGLFTMTFASFIKPENSWHAPGAPFLLAGFLVAAGLVAAWMFTEAHEPAK